MIIYGYEKDSEDLLKLEEASILCSVTELEKIICFLIEVKKEHEKIASNIEICHSHYRDWDKEWDKSSSDLIIATKQ